ncbi:hypothetical protein [Actinospongicola halichondriae]|uniref:hypothetical protein n=1 Tax=Actinospongicola halichondriae TaxID=3236844 RepID=UPI003D3EAC38
MKIHKLESTDAFISFDLDDAPSVGITRLARKVLQDGATLLARSTTYSFASFEIQMGGASAGINAEGDDVDPAVASFVDEAKELVSSGRWATDPGLGLTEADLGELRIADPRPAELWTDDHAVTLAAEGAVAAAGALLDTGLNGATWAVEGKGPVVEAAKVAMTREGAVAAPGAGGADTECDVLFLAGKTGMLDHDGAAVVKAKIVVPLTPVPVTARAHAELSKAGRIHVPDFLAIAAPLLFAHDASGGDPVERVGAAVAALAGEGTGLWMAAVQKAEAYLSTWQDELPFGRPLA